MESVGSGSFGWEPFIYSANPFLETSGKGTSLSGNVYRLFLLSFLGAGGGSHRITTLLRARCPGASYKVWCEREVWAAKTYRVSLNVMFLLVAWDNVFFFKNITSKCMCIMDMSAGHSEATRGRQIWSYRQL